MLRHTPTAAVILASLSGPALAQDSARDRAELDAAAGRLIFHNVLLADPQAFSARPRASAVVARMPGSQPRTAPGQGMLQYIPASAESGDAAADRREFDAAAGRLVPLGNAAGQNPSGTRAQAARSGQKVRVVLPSPYGR
jgi:hypothetical protein